MIPSLLPVLLLAAPQLGTGSVSVFDGALGQPGRVVVHAETGGTTPSLPVELQAVEIVPIDFTGRSSFERFLPASGRLVSDPQGPRILLPARNGSLYRVRRPDGQGGFLFGLLWIKPTGLPVLVAELPGTGAGRFNDPFVGRIGLSPDGRSVLATTTMDAGGSLLEIDLAKGRVVDRTAGMPPQTFLEGSGTLLNTWGAAATTSGILVFPRIAGGLATAVRFPGATPAYFEGPMVHSQDQTGMATIAGDSPTSAHVFAFGPAGIAVQVTDAPAELSGAGFQPEVPDGPYLALSTDASLAAWRVEGLAREVYSAPVRVPNPHTKKGLTGDALFVDTLDDSGVIGFLGPTVLRIVVGETAGPVGGVENGDAYQFTLDGAGTPTGVVNLSLTSGDTTPPFGAGGVLTTSGDLFRVPGFDGLFGFNEESGGAGRLIAVPFDGSPTTVLLDDVKNIRFVELAGDFVVLVAERDDLRTKDIVSVHTSMAHPARILGSLPDTFRFTRAAVHPETRQYAFVVQEAKTTNEWLVRTHAATGAAHVFHKLGVTFGPSLSFTPSGSLGTTLELPVKQVYAAWHLNGEFTYYQLMPAGRGQFLPSL